MKARFYCSGVLFALAIACSDDNGTDPPADSIPPASVTDLSAVSPGSQEVTLSWTAPGDDGVDGRATRYDLRYSAAPLAQGNWDLAISVDSVPDPSPAGYPENLSVALDHADQLYFGLKSADEVLNWSGLSNIVNVSFSDTTAPSQVSDLMASQTGPTEVTLTWTAPGDDGAEGSAAEYDLRYSATSVSEDTWKQAARVPDVGAPAAAGTSEQFTVVALTPGETYFVALKAVDDSANWSALSNVAVAHVFLDTIPPAGVTDLSVAFVTGHSISLSWTAPGDDDREGRAMQYDIRYATAPLTPETWEAAVPVEQPPAPAEPFVGEFFAVDGLELETMYFIALRTADENQNWSEVSNVASAATVALQQFTTDFGSGHFAAKPEWSPDGKTLAFSANWSGDLEIFTVPATGGPFRRLTFHSGDDMDPTWSPDGQRIAFVSQRGTTSGVWSLEPANLEVEPTLIVSGETDVLDCAWSPDGTRIAYAAIVSTAPPSASIYTVSSSGGVPSVLVGGSSINTLPAWSPDGTRIAFQSKRSGNWDIWVVPSDGGDATPLTQETSSESQPAWSPDGSRIALSSDRMGDPSIWGIAATGGEATQLTFDSAIESYPSWSRDGSAIAFASDKDGNYNIWVIYLF